MSDYPASPVISVIIPTYNMEPWITDTIHSVLKQSFSNFECIIIDDGSTDNTVSTIQQIHDPRLHILQQTNQGVSAARNTGLSHAKGQYIAFMDADDYYLTAATLELLFPSAYNIITEFFTSDTPGFGV